MTLLIDTYPRGDISIEYDTGTPLEITCIVNESLIEQYPNVSSNLTFMIENEYVPEDKVSFLFYLYFLLFIIFSAG